MSAFLPLGKCIDQFIYWIPYTAALYNHACDISLTTWSKINQSFDHISIFTKILLNIVTTSIIFRRLWKSINVKKIKEMKKRVLLIKNSKTKEQINTSIKKLQKYLIKVIDKTVSWTKSSSENKSFWSRNCFEAVFEARKLRRKWTKYHLNEDWQKYVKSNNRKKNNQKS